MNNLFSSKCEHIIWFGFYIQSTSSIETNVNIFFVFCYIFRKFFFCKMHNKYYGYKKKFINKLYSELLENESHNHE
jgi:hypothetical protein